MLDSLVGEVLNLGEPEGTPLEEVARRILPNGVRLEVDPPAQCNILGEWDAKDMTVMEAVDTLFLQIGYDVETVASEGGVVVKARPYRPYDNVVPPCSTLSPA